MTIPKRGSRLLTVDQTAYRFTVREATDSQTHRMIAEDTESPGHLLTVLLPTLCTNGVGTGDAHAFVRYALNHGWSPRTRGRYEMTEKEAYEALRDVGR